MDIEKEINDIIAPVTRAYSNFQIQKISILGSEIHEKRARFTVVFTADRTPLDPMDAIKEMIDGKPNLDRHS